MEEIDVFSDGGSRGNPGQGACAFVIKSKHNIIAKASKHLGYTTNNIAEYEGVILALTWLSANINSPIVIHFYVDSELVFNQLTGKYKIKIKHIKELVIRVKYLETKIPGTIFYKHVPRSKNKLADKLVNMELDKR